MQIFHSLSCYPASFKLAKSCIATCILHRLVVRLLANFRQSSNRANIKPCYICIDATKPQTFCPNCKSYHEEQGQCWVWFGPGTGQLPSSRRWPQVPGTRYHYYRVPGPGRRYQVPGTTTMYQVQVRESGCQVIMQQVVEARCRLQHLCLLTDSESNKVCPGGRSR